MDTLRLVVTSDTHGGLSPSLPGECALPRLASAMAAARGDRPTVLLDNGDTFFGGPLVDHLAQGPAVDHVVARWLASCGYSALNIGNEDLRLGLPQLDALARVHALPLVSTNVVASPDGAISRHRVLTRSLASGEILKIGVLGSVPATACQGLDPPQINPPRASLAEEAAKLTACGCDLIIALCHTGMHGGRGFPQGEAEAIALAAVPGVSAVVAGHLHEVGTARTADGVPIVAPGSYGHHFGLIDFEIGRRANGKILVSCVGVSVPTTAAASPDPQVARLLAPALAAMRARREVVLGWRRDPLTTAFAPLLRPSAVRWMEACLREFVATAMGQDDVIVATQSAGGRGPLPWVTVPGGPVRAEDLARLFPYENTLELTKITGATLLAWLQESAAQFNQVDPTANGWWPLIDESVPLCDHDYFSDIDFAIDLSAPPEARVQQARWRSQPIRARQSYLVAISSYRLARLARRWPAGHTRQLAPCLRTLLAGGLAVELPGQAEPTQQFLPLGSRPQLYFRARMPAPSPLPSGIRHLADCDSATVYSFDPARGD